MKICVTGAAGFIASHFTDMCVDRDWEVLGVDAMLEGSDSNNINPKIEFMEERCEYLSPRDLDKVETIVHCAAMSNVDTSIRTPGEFMSNVLATQNMCEIAKKLNIPIIIISTDELYNSFPPPFGERISHSSKGYTELSLLRPSNPYSASKAASDLVALSYFHTYGTDVRITRCANNYGTRQKDKLIPTILEKAFKGEEIPVFKTPATRNWLYVLDHCSAVFTVMEEGSPGEIYNISSEEELSPQQVIEKFQPLFTAPLNIKLVEDRPGYDLCYRVDSSKIRELGWKPSTNLEGAREVIYAYYRRKFEGSKR